jgi:hypothetical protein
MQAPVAAFHSARVISEWHAGARFATEKEAADNAAWAARVLDEQLW